MQKIYNDKPCVDCGRVVRMHIKSKRCKACQAAANRRNNTDQKRAKAMGKTRTLGATDRCVACGKTYIINSGRQKYCNACAIQVAQKNMRINGLKYYAEKNKEGIPRICVKCHVEFISKNLYRKSCYNCRAERGHEKPPKVTKEKPSKMTKEKGFDPDEYIYERKRAQGQIVYKAGIAIDGKQIHLGYFPTREAARQARIDAYNAHSKEDT